MDSEKKKIMEKIAEDFIQCESDLSKISSEFKDLWDKACDFDGRDRKSLYMRFSKDNKFLKDLLSKHKEMGELIYKIQVNRKLFIANTEEKPDEKK